MFVYKVLDLTCSYFRNTDCFLQVITITDIINWLYTVVIFVRLKDILYFNSPTTTTQVPTARNFSPNRN